MVMYITQVENAMTVLTLLHIHSAEAGLEAALADLGMTQAVVGMGNGRCILHFAARGTLCLPAMWMGPRT